MPTIKSMEELRRLREETQKSIKVRVDTGTRITVGMGTCGIAAGARDVVQAILDELQKREIDANVTTVGCIGLCSEEPLVDVEQAGSQRITYGKIKPEMVPHLIEEHLVNGNIVQEWVVGKLGAEG